MIEIKRKEYIRLLKRDAELSMMEAAGVDNWSGYGECFRPDWGENLETIHAEIDEKNKGS